MKFKALLFDVDGTAVDLEVRNKKIIGHLMNQAGLSLNDDDWQYLSGMTDPDKWRALAGDDPLFSGGDPDFKNIFSTPVHFEQACEQSYKEDESDIHAVEQTKRIVFEFIENKRAVTAVSNSNFGNVRKNLRLADYGEKFDLSENSQVIVSKDFVIANGGKPKPAADAYKMGLQKINDIIDDHRLRISPHDCLVLEDSVTGVRAGLKFGATVIQITDNCDSPDMDEIKDLTGRYNGRYIATTSDKLYQTYQDIINDGPKP